jgi:hypothetical protein
MAGLDHQLALVELAVPIVQSIGTVLTLVAVIFIEIQVRALHSLGAESIFFSRNSYA